jgi:hypothetical protein
MSKWVRTFSDLDQNYIKKFEFFQRWAANPIHLLQFILIYSNQTITFITWNPKIITTIKNIFEDNGVLRKSIVLG